MCALKDAVKEMKGKSQTGRKYLYNIHPIKDLCSEAIKNSYDSIQRRQNT